MKALLYSDKVLMINFYLKNLIFTLAVNEPRSIFSKPTAKTQSLLPVSISCLAKIRAVEPVEQLLLTLYTGIPVKPKS